MFNFLICIVSCCDVITNVLLHHLNSNETKGENASHSQTHSHKL